MWPCVPCTAPWLQTYPENGTTEMVRKLKQRRKLQCLFCNPVFTSLQYNTGERKQLPVEIFASLGEQSVGCKERQSPDDTVLKAVIWTRTPSWPRVAAQSSGCNLNEAMDGFTSSAEGLFFSQDCILLMKDLLRSSEIISLSYWFLCLPMAIITAEWIIQGK